MTVGDLLTEVGDRQGWLAGGGEQVPGVRRQVGKAAQHLLPLAPLRPASNQQFRRFGGFFGSDLRQERKGSGLERNACEGGLHCAVSLSQEMKPIRSQECVRRGACIVQFLCRKKRK